MASGNGILGTRALVANLTQSIAQPLNSDGVVASLNVVNRNQSEVKVTVAVTDTVNEFDSDAYYIEYNTTLGANDALERSGITVGAGQYITVRANSDNVTAVCWGIHYGDPQTVPDAIPDAVPFALLRTLDNPNAYSTPEGDQFGNAVAVDGNYGIVGAYTEDNSSGFNAGAAYIFNLSTGAVLHTLDPGTLIGDERFGRSVGISGNYAIVGADQHNDLGGADSGKAFIFDVTTGALVHTLDNPNDYGTSPDDWFGYSVGISGNYAIVGAWGEDDGTYSNVGTAYIFNVTTGALVHTLVNPNPVGSSDDNFGYSVGISGNYAIAGAPAEAGGGFSASGKAYIYNVTTGALVHTLDNPNAEGTTSYDTFGGDVAISGNYAIIGAQNEDDGTYFSTGKAYIFDVTTGNLLHTLDNPNAYGTTDNDEFGNAVGISSNYAIVGARYEDDAGGVTSGKAYIFDVTTGDLVKTLDNPNDYGASAYDLFGNAVAISDNYVLVGAQQEDEDLPGFDGDFAGKAYVFNVD